MKGKGVILSVVLAGAVAMPASADYTKIQHNLIGGTPDTSFDPNNGQFVISETTGAGTLTLSDPAAGTPAGAASNVTTTLTTFFDQVLSATEIQFTNGAYSLTFDLDDDAFGDADGQAGPQPYEISGTIAVMQFTIGTLGNFGKLDGIGNWNATTVNLPGSGVWPDGGGFSGIDTLTIDFSGTDLANFDWQGTVPLDGQVETTYSIFPNGSGIPEPASLVLMALGAAAMVRRRR